MSFDSIKDHHQFLQEIAKVRPDIERSLLVMNPEERENWIAYIRTAAKEGNPFAVRLISQLTLNRISE